MKRCVTVSIALQLEQLRGTVLHPDPGHGRSRLQAILAHVVAEIDLRASDRAAFSQPALAAVRVLTLLQELLS